MSAQTFRSPAMGTSESAEIGWEFPLEVGPPFREIRILVTMGSIRNVVSLADVSRSGIRLAVRRVVAQRFHPPLSAFVDENCVVVAANSLHPKPLKLVDTCVGTVLTL